MSDYETSMAYKDDTNARMNHILLRPDKSEYRVYDVTREEADMIEELIWKHHTEKGEQQ